MAIYDCEDVLVAERTFISANIGARLTAIQTAKADGITLSAPITKAYTICEQEKIYDLPHIQILPDNADNIVPGLKHDEFDYKIIIIAHVNALEGEIEKCSKRAHRFTRAIKEVMRADRQCTGQFIEHFITNVNYKPMMTDGYALKQEVWIYVTVKVEERT